MIGPSTKQALQAIADGIPLEEAGRNGTTNGAAMKAAPLGIISDYKRLDQLIDHVSLLCLPTHHTPVAIAGASIVAALSSYALQGGCDLEDMWGLAERVCSHRKAYDLAAELDDIREYMVRHEKAEILRYLEKREQASKRSGRSRPYWHFSSCPDWIRMNVLFWLLVWAAIRTRSARSAARSAELFIRISMKRSFRSWNR